MLTGKNENELRKEYIAKHPDITHQDYLIWKRQSNTKKDEKVAEEEKDELDEYYIPITETEGDLYGNETLYEALKEMNKRNAILLGVLYKITYKKKKKEKDAVHKGTCV